jgi:hypothetical protein
MLHETWQHLRLLGITGAAGAIVILRWSSARLAGCEDNRSFTIGEHG